jgi:F0F1-type ATP synthase epsilon subunit
MRLNISGPFEKKDVMVAWVEINTSVGNFVIQPEHAPMIVTLTPQSKIAYRLQSGKEEVREVINGVAHVSRKDVTILLTR